MPSAPKRSRTWSSIGPAPRKPLSDLIGSAPGSAAKPPQDTRSEAQREFDSALGGQRPDAYRLDGLYVGRGAKLPADNIPALDATIREALSSMKIPAQLGRGVADAMLDAWDARSQYTEPQRGLADASLRVDLERITGVGWDTAMATAREAFNLIPAATRDILISHGVFDSLPVLSHLYQHGARLKARAGR